MTDPGMILRPAAAVLIALACSFNLSAQKDYIPMMYDMSVNFYDVCAEAERYFETHDKGKGSGYKGYLRWKHENESKYYPTGDRSQVDPYFVWNQYQAFLDRSSSSSRFGFENGWRDLGPYDANNITEHYSPGIGRVETFYIDPNDVSHIYMGSRSGGFWRTNDEGATWENTTDTLPASGCNTIAASPTNPDSVLINVQTSNNSTTFGVWRSIDGGETWVQTAFNPTNLGWGGLGNNARIFKIVYHPTIADLILVGTSNGLYRSTDNLQTWTQLLNGADIVDIEFHPTNPDILYCYDNRNNGTWEDVVLRSTDTGVNWTQGSNLINNNGGKIYIAVSPDCDSCVYAASSNGVWKSDDEGVNWNFLSNPDESCTGFAVSDIDHFDMIYGLLDVQASLNDGQSWFYVSDWSINGTTLPSDYVHADLRAAECLNGVFYGGTDGYLVKSTDNGSTWTRLNDGTGIREFYAVGLSQSNWEVDMSGSQDNGTSFRNETGWVEWNGGDGMEAVVQCLNPEWMMGSWQFGTRQVTFDGGLTRETANTPESGSGTADWQAPMFFDPNHQMSVYHFSENVFRTDDYSNTWTQLTSPNIGIIQRGSIAENNTDIMMVTRNSSLTLTTDGGQTWSPVGGLSGNSIRDIAFDPYHDSTVVVTYNRFQADGNKVFITHDLGQTWTNITYNLGDMPIRTAVIDHSPERYIYVGGEIGVYYKAMNSTTWTLYSPGLPNVGHRDLEIQWGTNLLRAATWGRGLWDYPLVGREDYPMILTTEISDPPTFSRPKAGTDQWVTSVISHDNVTAAWVQWSVDFPTLDQTITMTNTQDSTWVSSTPIPNYNEGTELYFKVYAVGTNQDTTETYKFHYTVREGIVISVNEEPRLKDEVTIYPNPTNGRFHVDLGQPYQDVELTVMDATGKRVFFSRDRGQVITLSPNLPAGNYLLMVKTDQDETTKKLIIE